MDRLRRVVNNTAISLLGQVITWTSTLILTIGYGRFLGDFKFGELYFATTFVLLIGIPIERGFDQQITREVSQKPEDALRYLSNTLLIKGSLWLLLYLVILGISHLLGYTTEVQLLVAICGLTLLSTGFTTTFASMHYSVERVIFTVVGTILEKGLSALVGFLLLKAGASIFVMAFILLGGSLMNMTWQAIWFYRSVGLGFVIDKAIIRKLLVTAIPFMVYGMMGVLYYRLDTVLLSLMTSDTVVGWYGAGYRLFDTLVFLPSLVISAIMYPVFSKLSVSSEKDLKLAVEKTLNFLLFCAIPTATLMVVAAPHIIGFLYHRDEFNHTIPVLQALAPGIVFLYANSVFSAAIVSMKQEKKIMVMAAVALVFNFTSNMLLIPLLQHVGAAIITSLTEVLLCSIYVTISLPRHLLPWKSLGVVVRALLASLIMALAIMLLRTLSLPIILPVAIVVYLVAALLLNVIPREDLQALLRAVRRKAQPAVEQKKQDTEVTEVTGITETTGAMEVVERVKETLAAESVIEEAL